ncbi:MAG: methyltransferase domain-containing protein [Pseudomonadota bacterium]
MTERATPDDILRTYDTGAEVFARERNRTLFEKANLDRMLGVTPRNDGPRRLLDLGCGPGVPIARYLAERGMAVTGVDGAAGMITLFRQNLPDAEAIHADMRTLDLGPRFDAILAWHSFFHLPPDDQRAMFDIFARHAAPRAALMFTTGPEAGEAYGHAAGGPVYHASLSPDEYRDCLDKAGFNVLAFRPDDPECDRSTVWLARAR